MIEPIEFELLCCGELSGEGCVGFRNALFLLVDEGLTEGEEKPVAVGDEDVVEEFAEFRVIGGRHVLLNRAKEICIGPPLVSDELGHQGNHGRNLAVSGRLACRRIEITTMCEFFAGDRVRVADEFFWACGATGTIAAPPDAVVSISGRWDNDLTRQEKSALGTHTVYWVWFDEPQLDAEGDGPFRGGSIWARKLSLLPPTLH
jgi:hypothetical protein